LQCSNSNRDDLQDLLVKTELIKKGLDYNLLAVFGPQSSGKSTLLNALFSTKFPTMQANTGRYQVTKGVCASKAQNDDILVMDLEGTDSKERGEENAVSFLFIFYK
jgi:septin family protein